MTRKEILENELKIFLKLIKAGYDPEKVILFGSLAKDQVREDSDLDLVVIAETKQNFWERMKSLRKFNSHKIGMDVLMYTPSEFNNLVNNRTFFRDEVVGNGVVLYDKSKTS